MDWTKIAKKCKKEQKKEKHWLKKNAKSGFKKQNGFYAQECWDLDRNVAFYILPRLAFLAANHIGHPFAPQNEEEVHDTVLQEQAANDWQNILDKMVEGFYLYCFKDSLKWNNEEKALWKETKKLFMENFEGLWD